MKVNYSKPLLLGALLVSLNAVAQKAPFIDKSHMDLSVKPGDDFYQYASGTWIKANPVPAKETRWGSFNLLRDFNINAVKTILNDAANNKNAAAGSVEKRVGDFYAAGMDSVTIDRLGYTPIKADLVRISKISDLKGILNETATMRTRGAGSPMFGFFIGQDRKNVESMIPQLSQGGTTILTGITT